jgi:hypothetical protein
MHISTPDADTKHHHVPYLNQEQQTLSLFPTKPMSCVVVGCEIFFHAPAIARLREQITSNALQLRQVQVPP